MPITAEGKQDIPDAPALKRLGHELGLARRHHGALQPWTSSTGRAIRSTACSKERRAVAETSSLPDELPVSGSRTWQRDRPEATSGITRTQFFSYTARPAGNVGHREAHAEVGHQTLSAVLGHHFALERLSKR